MGSYLFENLLNNNYLIRIIYRRVFDTKEKVVKKLDSGATTP